jgi:hypothetical protein
MALKGKKLVRCPFKILVNGTGGLWTASATGGEFYFTTGVPVKPLNVQINGVDAVEGTLGTINPGEWAYGDNDGLGLYTVYVKLGAGTDPDLEASGYIKCSEPQEVFQAPAAPDETIGIGMLISNNEDIDVDADIVIYIDNGAGTPLATYIMPLTIKGTDGPVTEQTKMIMEPNERFMILSNKELVSIMVSENEG